MRAVIIVVWRAFQAPVEADPQAVQLERGHHDVGGDRADDQPGDPQRLVEGEQTMTSTTMLSAARRVGIQGRWTAKKVRVSSRFSPPKGRLNANQNSAIETRWVDFGAEGPAFEDQPHDRGGEHDHEHRRGDQQEVDLAHPDPDRAAHPAGVPPRGHAAEGREQHGGHRHAEDPLGEHVDAKRVFDRARALVRRRAFRTPS